jgi:hypothetical protein
MKRISHPEKSFFASSRGTKTRRENEERTGFVAFCKEALVVLDQNDSQKL